MGVFGLSEENKELGKISEENLEKETEMKEVITNQESIIKAINEIMDTDYLKS